MRRHFFTLSRIVTTLCVAGVTTAPLALVGCQKRGEPELSLTQEQWRRIRENILTALPDDEALVPIDVQFGDALRLRAVRPPDLHVRAGDPQELVAYWEVLRPANDTYRATLLFDAHDTSESREHVLLDGQLDSRTWTPGDIIVDRIRYHAPLTINGRAQIRVEVFDGEARLDEAPHAERRVHPKGFAVAQSIITWTPPRLVSVYTTERILLDGLAQEPAWKSAPLASPMVDPVTGGRFDGQPTAIQSLWNDEGLFFYLRMTDTHVWGNYRRRDDPLWEEENIELFLDPLRDGKDYLEIQVSPANVIFDALFAHADTRDLDREKRHTVPGLRTAVHVQGTLNRDGDNDVYWSVELFVPFASLPQFAFDEAGGYTQTGINLFRYDRPTATPAEVSAWAPVGPGSFHRPERFGELRLTGKPTPTRGNSEPQ